MRRNVAQPGAGVKSGPIATYTDAKRAQTTRSHKNSSAFVDPYPTIPDLLRTIGWKHRWNGHRGRARCPLHGGDNPHAFSFTAEVFKCHVCDAKGGAKKLRELLGLTPVSPPRRPFVAPRLERVDPLVFAPLVAPHVAPPALARLETLLAAHQVTRQAIWTLRHQGAVALLAAAEALLADCWRENEGLFETAAGLAAAALAQRDQADTMLGCDCRTIGACS